MVGYRYYETEKVDVLFPFGYGLSYTSFVIENCSNTITGALGSGLSIEVTGNLRNTGDRDGKEVIQLYVGLPESDQPVKLLKDFIKVEAKQDSSTPFSMSIDESDLMTYDTETNSFSAKPGTYHIYMGTSVRDIVYEVEVEL